MQYERVQPIRDRVTVIAEIGENFIGNIDIALDLVDKAAWACADIVKFQSYFGKDFKDDDPEKEWFKRVELSNENHQKLKKRATANGIHFLSSPFTVERAKFLVEQLKMDQIKIASAVMMNFPLLDYLNSSSVTSVILSTGLSTMKEIKISLSHLSKIQNPIILHCVTQYPCKDEEANLKAILTLKEHFPGIPIGYSDHTVGIEACLAAVALGATVIEKHFTFSKSCEDGTDHEISIEPEELKDMIISIQRIEMMLGTGIKVPSSGEKEILNFIRNRF